MNLVCFPGFTCGGVFCDILNKERSHIGKSNNFIGLAHNRGKIKVDNAITGTGYDPIVFFNQIKEPCGKSESTSKWIGTHCWPGLLDTTAFDHVINVTTTTDLSRVYRFARLFYAIIGGAFPYANKTQRPKNIQDFETFLKSSLNFKTSGFERVEKPNVINIEFETWVNLTCEVRETLLELSILKDEKHFDERRNLWLKLNDFLLDQRFDYILTQWRNVQI